jgi:hypothetical protein
VKAGVCDTLTGAFGVTVTESLAYVGEDSGLQILDISNPQGPKQLGFCSAPTLAVCTVIEGRYAYVADEITGLDIIDVSNPQDPQEVGHYNAPTGAWGIAVADSTAFLADAGSGLRVINIADPQNPREVGYYSTPDDAYGVAVAGGCATVADNDAGLQMVDFLGEGIQESRKPQASDPKLDVCIIRGNLMWSATTPSLRARGELLDVDGRKVLALKPGANDVSHLAPGVYFVWSATTPSLPAMSETLHSTYKVILTK